MRYHFIVCGAMLLLCAGILQGCKEAKDVSMANLHRIMDSVAAAIPGGVAIDAKIEQQRNLKIIFSNAAAYNATAAGRHKLAIKAGKIAMSIIGPGTEVKTGKLILTKEMPAAAWDKDPADGIVTDMRIDSLVANDADLIRQFSTTSAQ
jgi:phage-related minor tail protein